MGFPRILYGARETPVKIGSYGVLPYFVRGTGKPHKNTGFFRIFTHTVFFYERDIVVVLILILMLMIFVKVYLHVQVFNNLIHRMKYLINDL